MDTSKNILQSLMKLNYKYDTSLFNSYLLPFIVLKNCFNHIGKPNAFRKIISILNRKDYFKPLIQNKDPFIYKKDNESILVLPLPTLNKLDLPFWHTLGFHYAEDKFYDILKVYLKKHEYFYYLMHPADLMVFNDFKKSNRTIERMEKKYDLNFKSQLFINSLNIIKNSDRKVVTMEGLADLFFSKSIETKHSTN
jgi:hypothetical protein